MGSVDELLKKHGLDDYAAAFAEQGWDDLQDIIGLQDLAQLFTSVNMKPGHESRMRKVLKELAAKTAAERDAPIKQTTPTHEAILRSNTLHNKEQNKSSRNVQFAQYENEYGDTLVQRGGEKINGKGWTYQNELAEWKRYHRAFVERVKIEHLRERCGSMRDFCTKLLTLITCLTTLITSLAVGMNGGSSNTSVPACDSDGDAGEPAGSFRACSSWTDCFLAYQSYIFIFLSFITTVISAIVQLESPFWKRVDKSGFVFEQKYRQLEALFIKHLDAPLESRMKYEDFVKEREKMEAAIQNEEPLNVSPGAWRRTVKRVRKYGPSEWARAFLWLGSDLRWPDKFEIVEAMLLDFSEGTAGLYTLKPLSPEDGAKYRAALLVQKRQYFRRHRLSDRMGNSWKTCWLDLFEYVDCLGCCCCLYGPTRAEYFQLKRALKRSRKQDAKQAGASHGLATRDRGYSATAGREPSSKSSSTGQRTANLRPKLLGMVSRFNDAGTTRKRGFTEAAAGQSVTASEDEESGTAGSPGAQQHIAKQHSAEM